MMVKVEGDDEASGREDDDDDDDDGSSTRRAAASKGEAKGSHSGKQITRGEATNDRTVWIFVILKKGVWLCLCIVCE